MGIIRRYSNMHIEDTQRSNITVGRINTNKCTWDWVCNRVMGNNITYTPGKKFVTGNDGNFDAHRECQCQHDSHAYDTPRPAGSVPNGNGGGTIRTCARRNLRPPGRLRTTIKTDIF